MGSVGGAARGAVRVGLLVWVGLLAAQANAAPPETLPLTRVRLYETGIGYFERSGRISDRTRLPIPAAHLDDALKTLVILDSAAGSQLEGVRWDTRVTGQLGRALARLPTGDDTKLDFEALARSLTGSKVTLVVAGQTHTGQLLQVLARKQSEFERCLPGAEAGRQKEQPAAGEGGCLRRKQAALVLLRDSGELMRFPLLDVERIRPLRSEDANRLRAAFAAGGAGSARHELTVHGKLSDRVTLGYVAEAPLFRTTYRLLLREGGALLQAWALLHNDSDEDWSGVRVELVNGQPDSFLFPLAAPRYAHRRLVTPENDLPSVPQLLARGADELWESGEEESIGVGGLGLAGYGAGAGGYANREARVPVIDTESSLLAIGDLAGHAQAAGTEEGALFRYELPRPVDLPAHDSLLVPLLQEPVDATRVSFFAVGSEVAQSALLFHNSTRQTLPAGTFAIFEDGGFGGDSAIERLTPGEQRLLPFGLDLDVELASEPAARTETLRLCRFEADELIEHYARVEQFGYTLRNRSRSARSIYVELDVVNNAKIEGADAVLVLADESVSALLRVPPESSRKASLQVTQGLERRTPLSRLESGRLAAMARAMSLPQAQRAALARAGEQLLERERRFARKRQLSAELALLEQKTARARKSLPLVARADPERGRALATELVRSEARLAEIERARSVLDAEAPLRAARAALTLLNQ